MKQVWLSPPTNPPWEQMDDDYDMPTVPTAELKIQTDKPQGDQTDQTDQTDQIDLNKRNSPSIERKLNELRSPRIRGVESRSRILVVEKRQPSPPPETVEQVAPVEQVEHKLQASTTATDTSAIADQDIPQILTAAKTKGKNDFDNRVDTFADSIGQCATDCGKCKFCRASADKCHCIIL